MEKSAKKKKKALVAMSGGVDSSMAAFLLLEHGYDVTGIYMRLGDMYASSEFAARQVADHLGIKLVTANLAERFEHDIVSYFVDSYERGETPNPCVRCNRLIKFGALLEWKEKLGADFLATGHYARNIFNAETRQYELWRALDSDKDQSYFLYNLGQDELSSVIFPLGERYKKDVRTMADGLKIPNEKKESMDICFLKNEEGLMEQEEYLKARIVLRPGPIFLVSQRHEDGNRILERVGQHKGLPLYTIGQRKGIELGGTGPYYVAAMSYAQDALYVVKNLDDELLISDEVLTRDNRFVSGAMPDDSFACDTVLRYRHEPLRCVVSKAGGIYSEGKKKNDTTQVLMLSKLSGKQKIVASGQSIVWYDGGRVLGGGVAWRPDVPII